MNDALMIKCYTATLPATDWKIIIECLYEGGEIARSYSELLLDVLTTDNNAADFYGDYAGVPNG